MGTFDPPSPAEALALRALIRHGELNGYASIELGFPWRLLVPVLAREQTDAARSAVLATQLGAWGFPPRAVDRTIEVVLAAREGDAPPPPLLRFLRGPELRHLPPLQWLIPGLVPAASSVALYGEAEAGKSFLMLHMACHLALCRSWYGRPVVGGPVIYFGAEGQLGIRQRYEAWCGHYLHGGDVPDFILCPQPMYPTASEFVEALYSYVDSLVDAQPVLIVFDTLFRCFEGDENATADMGRFIRATDAIRARTGATIGLVHHTGWNTTRMRGNSALLGALDVVMRVEKDDLGTISLSCDKMKDAAPFAPSYFTLTEVPGTESVAATLSRDNRPTVGSVFAVPEGHMVVLGAVVAAGAVGIGFADLKRVTGVKRDATLAEMLKGLQRGDFVRADREVGQQGRRYVPTARGVMATSGHFGSTSEVGEEDE